MDDFLLVAKWLGIGVFVAVVLAMLKAFLTGVAEGIQEARDEDSGPPAERPRFLDRS